MESGGDEWSLQAMEDSLLAADVLVHLRATPPPTAATRQPSPDPVAGTSDPFEWPEWGARAKRCRFFIEDEEEVTAARRTRESPMTPMDFSGVSGSSDCGGEEAPSAARSVGAGNPSSGSSGREGKAPGAGGPGPSVFNIPDQKPIRRLMKKQSVAELQAIHRSLLEEIEMLHKEIEDQLKMQKELLGENFRLRKIMLSAELQSPPSETATLPEEEQPKQLQVSGASLLLPDLLLPDLNIPLFHESD